MKMDRMEIHRKVIIAYAEYLINCTHRKYATNEIDINILTQKIDELITELNTIRFELVCSESEPGSLGILLPEEYVKFVEAGLIEKRHY
jgi:hypothetical protein